MIINTELRFIFKSLHLMFSVIDNRSSFSFNIQSGITDNEFKLLNICFNKLPFFGISRKTKSYPELNVLVLQLSHKDVESIMSLRTYQRTMKMLVDKRLLFHHKNYGYMLNHNVIPFKSSSTKSYVIAEKNKLEKRYKLEMNIPQPPK